MAELQSLRSIDSMLYFPDDEDDIIAVEDALVDDCALQDLINSTAGAQSTQLSDLVNAMQQLQKRWHAAMVENRQLRKTISIKEELAAINQKQLVKTMKASFDKPGAPILFPGVDSPTIEHRHQRSMSTIISKSWTFNADDGSSDCDSLLMMRELEQKMQELTDANRRLQSATNELETMNASLTNSNSQLAKMNADLMGSQAKLAEHVGTRFRLAGDADVERQTLAACLSDLETYISILQESNKHLQLQLEETETMHKCKKEVAEHLQTEVLRVQDLLSVSENKRAAYHLEVEQLRAIKDHQEKKIQQLIAENAELHQHVQKLQEKLNRTRRSRRSLSSVFMDCNDHLTSDILPLTSSPFQRRMDGASESSALSHTSSGFESELKALAQDLSPTTSSESDTGDTSDDAMTHSSSSTGSPAMSVDTPKDTPRPSSVSSADGDMPQPATANITGAASVEPGMKPFSPHQAAPVKAQVPRRAFSADMSVEDIRTDSPTPSSGWNKLKKERLQKRWEQQLLKNKAEQVSETPGLPVPKGVVRKLAREERWR